MNLNYLLFHAIFTLPVLFLLLVFYRRIPEKRLDSLRNGMVIMIFLAVVYTSPWDALLINEGIWYYGEGVVSVWILGIPLGEYLFFVIQTVGASLLLYHVGFDPSKSDGIEFFGNLYLALPFLVLTVLGLFLSVFLGESWLYLGAIIAWVGPVLLIQWAYGGQKLLGQKIPITSTVIFSSIYLWFIDSIAIGESLWILPLETRTGIEFLGLPLEEAVFFLATNLMVVQGLILYEWTMSREEPIEGLKEVLSWN